MRAFACVVGAKSASWRSGVCDAIRPHRKFVHIVNSSILQNSSTLQFTHVAIHPYCKIHPRCKFVHITIHPCGRANCNSPLHVRYPNVGKYTYKSCKYTKKTSWAWYEGICVCRRGKVRELAQWSMWAIRPHHNSPTSQIHPCCKFVHIVNSSMLQIHLCCKFIHISNSPMWKGELQFAPTHVFSGCWQIYM